MDDDGDDALVQAVQSGELDVVTAALRGKKANACTFRDAAGCSLLHWAAANNRVAIAQALLHHHAETDVAGGLRGESPLMWAVRGKHYYHMLGLLLSRGRADLAFKSAEGIDALHLAVRLGHVNTVLYLLDKGADPNTLDALGQTPVHWLLKNRTGKQLARPLRLLLRFGASVTYSDPVTQNTALHICVLVPDIDYRSAMLIHQVGTSSPQIVARTPYVKSSPPTPSLDRPTWPPSSPKTPRGSPRGTSPPAAPIAK